MPASTIFGSLKSIFVGRARSLTDRDLFHKVSLVALFAWVGLGADGLSSSCYGPEETFRTLGAHPHLAVFVALASVITITAICASYSQIISLFPTGGGGYLVASKLLSPAAGVVSGSALLIDYVLTITISVASGADALFSLLSPEWLAWKLPFALAGVTGLTLLNLRGVRESVVIWVPVFFVFVGTHAFAILYALFTHGPQLGGVATATVHEVRTVSGELGWIGLFAILLKAYSMGAGTYTGIEAVSNGLPILREPRVQTGRRTMVYMGVSLAVTVAGLLLAYLLYAVVPVDGKTLNAVLFEKMTANWGGTGTVFVFVTLASEAALLLIAAQAGFLDGPRVLANMALDRWFPTRFTNLSDRFVTQNGILLMGGAGLLMMAVTDRLMPAKTPCVREYDRISAFNCASVAARASRPTGPAATDASAPSDTRFFSSLSTPRSFMTSMTRSMDCAPNCRPQLPLPSRMNIGALQAPSRRQLINPLPYSPPTMNAAFLRPGTTMTQAALSHRSSGTS